MYHRRCSLEFLVFWSFVFGSEPPGVVEIKTGFPSLVLIKLWCWPSLRAYIRVVLFRKKLGCEVLAYSLMVCYCQMQLYDGG